MDEHQAEYSKTRQMKKRTSVPVLPPDPRKQHNSKTSHRTDSQLSLNRATASETEREVCSYVRLNMNQSGKDYWHRHRLSDHHDNNTDEDDYAVPEEDYDDGIVHIQPAKHCPTNTEYADRRPDHRPLPCVPVRGDDKFNTPPRPPKRVIPGPAVNRACKPGREAKTKTEGFPKSRAPETNQNLKSPQRPAKPVAVVPGHVSTVVRPRLCSPGDESPADPLTSPIEPTWREQHKFQANSKSSVSLGGSKSKPPLPTQRLSLDLESQELFDARKMHGKEGTAERPSVKRNHEWPQDKGDLDHTNFSPQERPAEMSDWYVGAFSRVEAEHALHLVNRGGAFLVRDCSKCTPLEPLVLAVFYENRVFNIQIRYSQRTSQYTLGTGLRTNDEFNSVADIIKFHSIFPIALIDGRHPNEDHQKRSCVLMYPITRENMLQLLSI
ncbi:cytokine-dependent hematopoietic cell linker isoform X2 [Clupea harengus]|uniref:Cytokine-dependent hematopoietic cell linker isoform X2 n=1 Tax=Clupea harengus TaxID=7950 RepID=A0A8M1KMW2_CLUHA|nr:cytokine-dependent hematopoietic cell linker isoform X2 [Clupea harengus]